MTSHEAIQEYETRTKNHIMGVSEYEGRLVVALGFDDHSNPAKWRFADTDKPVGPAGEHLLCMVDYEDKFWPCSGADCTVSCPRDDCFIERRALGYPDFLGEDLTKMSPEVRMRLDWMETKEGQEWALLLRASPSLRGDASDEEKAAFHQTVEESRTMEMDRPLPWSREWWWDEPDDT